MVTEILAIKDEENELPIPTLWRAIFCDVIKSFVAQDYKVSSGVTGVTPVSDDTAKHIKDYIEDYGGILLELSKETWESSICIWMGYHWDVLIDLRTVAEGRSDLVLKAQVSESRDSFVYFIEMVYVP
jgi:hypothetical protein